VLPLFFSTLLVWKSGAGVTWIRPRVLSTRILSVENKTFTSSYWFLNTSNNKDLSLPTFTYNFSVKNIK
jgi:hypothetical protein